MKRTYQVVTKPSTLSSRELAEFLSKDGQLLLPPRPRTTPSSSATVCSADETGRPGRVAVCCWARVPVARSSIHSATRNGLVIPAPGSERLNGPILRSSTATSWAFHCCRCP